MAQARGLPSGRSFALVPMEAGVRGNEGFSIEQT